MNEKSLKDIYMVAYDEKTVSICEKYPFSIYRTDKTSHFFENAYIRDLIEKGAHHDAEWFGVLSPAFFSKAMAGRITIPHLIQDLEKGIKVQKSRNAFEWMDAEAIGFHSRLRNRNIITQGNNPHGQDFSEITQLILNRAGINWNVNHSLRRIVMHNYVIAKPHIYDDYAKNILIPCMDVMEKDSDIKTLCWRDSRYFKKRNMSDKLKADLGVPYYPLHTFICERLWAVYLALNPQINFRHYGQS